MSDAGAANAANDGDASAELRRAVAVLGWDVARDRNVAVG